jgi:hypothetical protein
MTLPAVARYVGQLLYSTAQQLYAARAEPPPAAEAERAPKRARTEAAADGTAFVPFPGPTSHGR